MKVRKDEEIKARVDRLTKERLAQIATARQLDVSDIIREAVRDLLKRQPPQQELVSA